MNDTAGKVVIDAINHTAKTVDGKTVSKALKLFRSMNKVAGAVGILSSLAIVVLESTNKR